MYVKSDYFLKCILCIHHIAISLIGLSLFYLFFIVDFLLLITKYHYYNASLMTFSTSKVKKLFEFYFIRFMRSFIKI